MGFTKMGQYTYILVISFTALTYIGNYCTTGAGGGQGRYSINFKSFNFFIYKLFLTGIFSSDLVSYRVCVNCCLVISCIAIVRLSK